MGSVVSSIGRAIKGIVSAVANLIMIIVDAIITVLLTICDFIYDLLCCNFTKRRRLHKRTGTHTFRGRRMRTKLGV